MDRPLKNRKYNSGLTPFNLTAESGCQLFLNEIKNKNPKDKKGQTNINLGIKWEHKEISKFVLENTFTLL